MMVAMAATLGLFAEEAYTLVNAENGYSYIQINQDLDAFSFKSDFKSIGNGGQVGYVVYSSDMSDEQMAAAMEQGSHPPSPQFAKKIDNGIVDLGARKAGDRIGFYQVHNDGRILTTTEFVEKNGTTYLEFDKNGSGKDEWMSIENISATSASSAAAPTGAPLPGALAVLLVGGLGAGAMKKSRKRNRA